MCIHENKIKNVLYKSIIFGSSVHYNIARLHYIQDLFPIYQCYIPNYAYDNNLCLQVTKISLC